MDLESLKKKLKTARHVIDEALEVLEGTAEGTVHTDSGDNGPPPPPPKHQ